MLNVNDVISRYDSGENLEFVFFWGGYLSNWFKSDFHLDNEVYSSNEQFMMACKAIVFKDDVMLKKIMNEHNPREVKKLGRKVKNFDSDTWDEVKLNMVARGLLAKFSQNEKLKDYLLSTGDKILVEASPHDEIWGIKMGKDDDGVDNPNNWKGTNYLGFLLMEVRNMILFEEHSSVGFLDNKEV